MKFHPGARSSSPSLSLSSGMGWSQQLSQGSSVLAVVVPNRGEGCGAAGCVGARAPGGRAGDQHGGGQRTALLLL